MLDFLKNRKQKISHVLGAPVKGKTVSLKEVNDPTFREEILGKGLAMIPYEGKIYAPADGKIGIVFDTLHAISMTTEYGAEVLIHVGLDTVQMKGEGFEGHVKAGDTVKKGELLLTVDLEKIKAAGYDIITPMLICNTTGYESVKGRTDIEVNPGEDVLIIEEK